MSDNGDNKEGEVKEGEAKEEPKLEIVVPEVAEGEPTGPASQEEIEERRKKFLALPPEEQEAIKKRMQSQIMSGKPPMPQSVPTPPPAPPAPRAPSRKLILRNGQSPGDGIMLAFAVASLHESYPGLFQIDVRTPYNELFEGMYGSTLTAIEDNEAGVVSIDMAYETIHQSNQRPYHYMNGMVHDLALKLRLPIAPTMFQGFLPLRDEEKSWITAVEGDVGKRVPYWVINAGWKDDYSAKQWSTTEYQRLVDMFPDVYFAQIGHKDHNHPELTGDNVLNYVGETDLRQLVRLIWGAFGVISPCSMAMLLSYALPACEHWKLKSRACIALGGGREPNHWQQGPNQQYIHTCGILDCCDHGGCWKSRITPLGDGDNKDTELCRHPVKLPNGQMIAKCMDMIRAEDVARLMLMYINKEEFDSGSGGRLMKPMDNVKTPKGMRQLPGLKKQKQQANAQKGKKK